MFLGRLTENFKTERGKKLQRILNGFWFKALWTALTVDALCVLKQNLTMCQAASGVENPQLRKTKQKTITVRQGTGKGKGIWSKCIMKRKKQGVSQRWCTSTTATVEKLHKLQKCFRLKNKVIIFSSLFRHIINLALANSFLPPRSLDALETVFVPCT